MSMLAAATLVALAGITLVAPATPAQADGSGNYANAALADKALSYVGRWGGEACRDAGMLDNGNTGRTVGGFGAGQCKTFVNCIVRMVSGGTQSTGGGSSYFQSFLNAGGQEITDVNALVKGDIVQKYVSSSDLHTLIIVYRVSGNVFDVVDSNYSSTNDEMVREHQYTVNLSSTMRAFRMGRSGSSYVGKIVQWYNGSGQPNTSWIVKQDGRRYWIPSTAVFWCSIYIGYSDAGAQSAGVLNTLPDSGQQASCPVAEPTTQDRLTTGQGLWQGAQLRSGDGRFTNPLQGDHNFVLYGPGGALWATNRFTGGYVIMQGDCNLVGYDMWAVPQWSSGTGGLGGGCTYLVQNDGNDVIYRSGDGRAVWDRYHGRL